MTFEIINKGITSKTDEDDLYITFVANTGLTDTKGDKLTRKAIDSIINQATSHNLHLEHGKTFNDVLGPIISAKEIDSGIQMTAKIRPNKKDYVASLLNDGVNVGSSISGVPIRNKENPNSINDWALVEVSLTPTPADQRTMGKTMIAKSLYDVVNHYENLKIENKGETNMSEENTGLTEERVIDLINEGFNDKQEAMIEDITEKINSEQDAKYNELKEAIETIKAELDKTKSKTEEGKESEEKTSETESEDKKIDLNALIEKSASMGAVQALEKFFGKDSLNNGKLNVKYEDKGYTFVKQPNGVKTSATTSGTNEEGGVEDKDLTPEEIAKLI